MAQTIIVLAGEILTNRPVCIGTLGLKSLVCVNRRCALPETQLKLEDLTVLKRSPDLLNNVKIGQDQLQLIMKHILFYGGCGHFGQVT